MQAFSYLRVSSINQVNGNGFERQANTIESYCKANNIQIVRVFKEKGVSGAKDQADRPAFQEMISEILKKGVRTVIVEGLDRLAREYRIQETLLIYLVSKGIHLISARTGEIVSESISDDPMKKALVQIQGVFSELEKNLLVKKLKLARESKKKKTGKCEGRKGYQEMSPEILKLIKTLRRKPKGKRRATYKHIAERLNKLGHTNANGKSFSGNTVQNILYRTK